MLSAANRKSGVSVLVDRKWHLRPAGSTITESSVPPESRCLIWLVWSFQSMKWHTSLGIKSLLRQAWNLLEWQSVVLIRCDDSQTEPSSPPGSHVGRIEGRAAPPHLHPGGVVLRAGEGGSPLPWKSQWGSVSAPGDCGKSGSIWICATEWLLVFFVFLYFI